MIKETIIDLVPSKYMREFLYERMDSLNLCKYIDIIEGLSISLDKKKELLKEILAEWELFPEEYEWVTFRDEKDEISYYIEFLDKVVSELKNFDCREGTIILEYIDNNIYDDDDCHNNCELFEYVPVPSYDEAVRLIKESYLEGTIFYKLEMYRLEGNCYEHKYTYTLDTEGEILFVDVSYDNRDYKNAPYFLFFDGNISAGMPVPYRPGDILYVDGKPFCNPAYCLIVDIDDPYNWNDCCSVRTLYKKKDGYINIGAFKHGDYCENCYCDYNNLILNADKYEGELPEEYSYMKEISDILKVNPELGEELNSLPFDIEFTAEQILAHLKAILGRKDGFKIKRNTVLECNLKYDTTVAEIPEAVFSIYEPVFSDNEYIEEIILPDSLMLFKAAAISCCPNLVSIKASETSKYFSTEDGVLFNKDKTLLIRCPEGKEGIYKIPESVVEIGSSAFSRCRNLTEIVIPEGVQKIQDFAFEYCCGMKNISMPNSIIKIGRDVFHECKGLTEINIGNMSKIPCNMIGKLKDISLLKKSD